MTRRRDELSHLEQSQTGSVTITIQDRYRFLHRLISLRFGLKQKRDFLLLTAMYDGRIVANQILMTADLDSHSILTTLDDVATLRTPGIDTCRVMHYSHSCSHIDSFLHR